MGAGEVPRYIAKVDDRGWGGQDLEDGTGRKVTLSYAANLEKCRVGNLGLDLSGVPSGTMASRRGYGSGTPRKRAVSRTLP